MDDILGQSLDRTRVVLLCNLGGWRGDSTERVGRGIPHYGREGLVLPHLLGRGRSSRPDKDQRAEEKTRRSLVTVHFKIKAIQCNA